MMTTKWQYLRLFNGKREKAVEKIDPYTDNGKVITEIRALLTELGRNVGHIGDMMSRINGLTMVQWRIMSLLHPEYHAGKPRTVPQIARLRRLTRQAISKTMYLLEDDGCVERLDNPESKKAVLWGLTKKGLFFTHIAISRQHRRANNWGRDIPLADLEKCAEVLGILVSEYEPERIKRELLAGGKEYSFQELERLYESRD